MYVRGFHLFPSISPNDNEDECGLIEVPLPVCRTTKGRMEDNCFLLLQKEGQIVSEKRKIEKQTESLLYIVFPSYLSQDHSTFSAGEGRVFANEAGTTMVSISE